MQRPRRQRPVATRRRHQCAEFPATRVEGDSLAWRPLRAFDDGQQVFIEFPAGIAQGEMPPLWVIGAEGGRPSS